jgi:hypothetical protein
LLINARVYLTDGEEQRSKEVIGRRRSPREEGEVTRGRARRRQGGDGVAMATGKCSGSRRARRTEAEANRWWIAGWDHMSAT